MMFDKHIVRVPTFVRFKLKNGKRGVRFSSFKYVDLFEWLGIDYVGR